MRQPLCCGTVTKRFWAPALLRDHAHHCCTSMLFLQEKKKRRATSIRELSCSFSFAIFVSWAFFLFGLWLRRPRLRVSYYALRLTIQKLKTITIHYFDVRITFRPTYYVASDTGWRDGIRVSIPGIAATCRFVCGTFFLRFQTEIVLFLPRKARKSSRIFSE